MTLSILFNAYIALLVIFVIFAIINVLHIIFLSVTDRISYLCTSLFLLAFIVIIGGSLIMLENVNWDLPLIESYNTAPTLFK